MPRGKPTAIVEAALRTGKLRLRGDERCGTTAARLEELGYAVCPGPHCHAPSAFPAPVRSLSVRMFCRFNRSVSTEAGATTGWSARLGILTNWCLGDMPRRENWLKQ